MDNNEKNEFEKNEQSREMDINKGHINSVWSEINPNQADIEMKAGKMNDENEMRNTENDSINKKEDNLNFNNSNTANENEFFSESKNQKENQNKETNQKPFSENSRREPYYHESVKHKNGHFKKVIAVIAIISLVGGGSIGASYALFDNFVIPKIIGETNEKTDSSSDEIQINPSIVKKTSSTAGSFDAVDIFKNVSPSVVSISTKATVTQNSFFGYGRQYEAQGAGSGVIFFEDDEKIYIATNAHVIDGANGIQVSVDEQQGVNATVIGADSNSDLAVISILKSDLKAAGIEGYKVAKFGDSDKVQVGESVLAIGNALGYGKTLTGGMISATNKEVTVENTKYNVLQTDAAINPGNSGGALVNSSGEVIGINSVKIATTGVEGMGYAIPSNVLTPIIEQLLTEGSVPRPYLGIVGTNVTEELGSLYKLPVGVFIAETVEGGSAQKAGIVAGDIITEFAGQKIMSMDTLVEVLEKQEVGSTVKASIIRDGVTPMEVNITIQDANAK